MQNTPTTASPSIVHCHKQLKLVMSVQELATSKKVTTCLTSLLFFGTFVPYLGTTNFGRKTSVPDFGTGHALCVF